MAGFEIFGFEIAKKKKKAKTFVTPENLDGATQIVDGGGILGHYLNTDSDAKDEKVLVQKYREMSFSHEVDGAIEDIINDAVIHEEGVPAVALDLESLEYTDSIKDKMHAEFTTILDLLDFNLTGADLFKKWYVDARLYHHIVIDMKRPKDGIKELIPIDPLNIEKIREVKKSKSWTESDVDLGTLNLCQYVNAKHKAKQNEIREYEKQFLSRYNVPKARLKSKGWTESDVDIGTLTLGQYVNAKRKAKQDEIREYEKQYLSRYKQPKPKKWTKQLEWEPEPKQDMKKERKEYESEFLTRYRKQQKAKPKKRSILLDWKPEPKPKPKPKRKRDIRKERKNYENEFLTRYKKQQKAKPKKNESKLLMPEPKIDRKKNKRITRKNISHDITNRKNLNKRKIQQKIKNP